MKKIHLVRRSLIFLLGIFIVTACSNERIITVSYQMKDVKEIIPSYQLTIWLEKPDGAFAKTLFVSEYLAYGGYLEYGICSSWTNKANWDNVTKEELDAVSGATPEPGDVRLELEFNLDELPDGEYQLFIQVHLNEDKNDTYKGKVKIISGKKTDVQKKPYKIEGVKNGNPKEILSNIEVTID